MCISLHLFAFVIIFTHNIKNISGQLPNDCSSLVKSNFFTYRGCKNSISTDSLTNPVFGSRDVHTFKGIPYAKPPINERRFRKTEPLTNTEPTTIDATQFRNPCIAPLPLDFPFPAGIPSEDCLFVNVYTQTLNSSAKLPVLFWIYGGGFLFGSSSQMIFTTLSLSNVYDGSQLAIRDSVVVTFNYRVGLWGYLYGNSSEAPGNAGLWDQAMALNWTRQNIGVFGGDPNKITIFGESAGSISCSNFIVSNVTRNWFQRAILQSGSSYGKTFQQDADYMYRLSRRFATSVSCDDSNNWIQCLRGKSTAQLVAAQISSLQFNSYQHFPISPFLQFAPMFGDEFLPISVNRAVKEGNFRSDIKILIGHNDMEGSLIALFFGFVSARLSRYNPFVSFVPFLTKNDVKNDIEKLFINNRTIGSGIAQKYTEPFNDVLLSFNPNPIRKSAAHALGDYYLTCPTILFGAYISKSSSFTGKVYQYRLTYKTTQSTSKLSVWAEATHTDDVSLVFGQSFKDRAIWTRYDRKLSKKIMDMWTGFARYGELVLENGNIWPEYSYTSDNGFNASYVELHADDERFGRIFVNRYKGNDGYTPTVIQNCFNYWDEIMSKQF